jgi:hypothetical protein
MHKVDDDGVPFWGGSRRRPTPLVFDTADSAHRSFVLWAAMLRGRACGLSDLRDPDDPLLVSAYDELADINLDIADTDNEESESRLAEVLINMGMEQRKELLGTYPYNILRYIYIYICIYIYIYVYYIYTYIYIHIHIFTYSCAESTRIRER